MVKTGSCYFYLKNVGKHSVYCDYLRGNMMRAEFLDHIPEDVINTVMCVEMSENTITDIFDRTDEIPDEDGITQVDVIIRLRHVLRCQGGPGKRIIFNFGNLSFLFKVGTIIG